MLPLTEGLQVVGLFKSTSVTCVVAICCAFFGGCRSRRPVDRPAMIFDRVPPLGPGGGGDTGVLRGHVIGAHAGQRIVLYALSAGVWWVQPVTLHPYTEIDPDGTWKNSTHLGARYAAVLVNPGFVPSNQLDVLPSENQGVAALTTVTPSSLAAPAKRLRFSNYDWDVRQIGSDRNGSPHSYAPGNASLDGQGFLHLGISRGPDGWDCSEVALSRSLGYGSYSFTVADVSKLDPAAVLRVFTWDATATDQDRREVDFVVSRWGNPKGSNAQYIVQPFFRPANTYRYVAPAGPATYVFRWEPAKATFTTFRGAGVLVKNVPVATHTFTADVPAPRAESVHMNLCTFDYTPIPQQRPAEVVVQRFQYLP